jgi:hypothetical protein
MVDTWGATRTTLLPNVFGVTDTPGAAPRPPMGLRSFLAGGSDGVAFDRYDEFVPAHLPDPGDTPSEGRVLTGRAHCAVHRLARALFEARGVYDVTFGYNLARLNLDPRHPDAGFRYAVVRDDGDAPELRATLTPTTPFCPQSDTLAVGAFRAWNGLSDRHEFDLVRVRVDESHHRSAAVNEGLADLEARYRETGAVPDPDESPAFESDGSEDGSGTGDPDGPTGGRRA